MKLGLSTDFGSERHWERLVEFAAAHGVDRLVWWADTSHYGFLPFSYPRYPGLLPDDRRAGVETVARRMRYAGELTRAAGKEFWCYFGVLDLPDVEQARADLPELFNAQGEPDMSGELVYQLIRDQVDELLAIVPWVHGVEMWIMEGSTVQIARLKHQGQPIPEICGRIVDVVHDNLAPKGIRLSQDLHTSGGDTVTLDALFRAASRHPDMLLSGDNVVGDFHLLLPFNPHLARAAQTNPVQVHFDVNGEYWGRNFVPTAALGQYERHLEEARRIGAEYVDGRVVTTHNTWSPHANVLPSRRERYPELGDDDTGMALPEDLDIPVLDTLGAFNAEFFCRRAKDPACRAEDVVRAFLVREFGPAAADLAPVFLRLEGVLAKVFFADTNSYLPQSILPSAKLLDIYGMPGQIVAPVGAPCPTPEMLRITRASVHPVAFAGWPTLPGHRCTGAEAMLAEKREAAAAAQELLAEVQRVAPALRPGDARFLLRQFEDLATLARVACALFEAHAHHFLLQYGSDPGKPDKPDKPGFSEKPGLSGSLPDRKRLAEVVAELRAIRDAWLARYPKGRYLLSERIEGWLPVLEQSAGKPSGVA